MNDCTYDQIQIEEKLIKNIQYRIFKIRYENPYFFHVKNEKERIFFFLRMPYTVILKVV
ncbi:hypothetical protein [Blattabacterium cuenoti]|uniref:hypothetical protein n=1 Tax=Blattabacterium cuenoti TaxID=1653831 RepID=UPI001EEC72FC|nr:hypothetical protein [Blattabacterium cuenoti]